MITSLSTLGWFDNIIRSQRFTKHQLLILASLYVMQTPCDSEILTQPALRRGILVSDPYHDADIVEAGLGLPVLNSVSIIILCI